jgi:hypothetical protein
MPVAGNLMENTQKYYHEIRSMRLSICTVATVVRATCENCGGVFGCDSNSNPDFFSKLYEYTYIS